ncbi:MAG TPA: electron transport complex subunit RsxD [Gammaproteobacteria bacterium]|nr:electron transport complex subunit RsxD [Gammaproteobacteria bacterium]
MKFAAGNALHPAAAPGVDRIMREVILALIPGTLAMLWFFGIGVLINLVLATVTALAAEAGFLVLRGRAWRPVLLDGSAALTGILLGLTLPPLVPWWIPALGALFAIVIAKQLYGGLGYNPFNPAMVGFVVLIISFPLQMTLWPPPTGLDRPGPGMSDTLGWKFGALPEHEQLDSMTMATPLDEAKTLSGLNLTRDEILADPRFGGFGGYGWEWINLAFLLGGLWLLKRRAIAWQIPAGMLGSLFVLAFLFYAADADNYGSPLFHLFSGAAMLGAFFIATDPVTASTTPLGRLYFGAGIGAIVFVIRTWGGYPDGVAFGVLLMNMIAPTIDYYTKPRVFGAPRDDGSDEP